MFVLAFRVVCVEGGCGVVFQPVEGSVALVASRSCGVDKEDKDKDKRMLVQLVQSLVTCVRSHLRRPSPTCVLRCMHKPRPYVASTAKPLPTAWPPTVDRRLSPCLVPASLPPQPGQPRVLCKLCRHSDAYSGAFVVPTWHMASLQLRRAYRSRRKSRRPRRCISSSR